MHALCTLQRSLIIIIVSLVPHSSPPHSADNDVQLYWQELQRACVQGGFLVLASGACFGGTRQWGSRIYMRSSYGILWARIKELVAEESRQIVVTGDWQEW